MARIRSYPGRQFYPRIKAKVMVDTFRGSTRIRAWPKPRGTPTDPYVRELNRWFTEANALAKKADPAIQKIAIEMSKGTGLYPRDLMLRAMSDGFVDIVRTDGTVLRQQRPFVEACVFNGFNARPTTNVNIGTGSLVEVQWPLPQIDTGGFYQPASPGRFLIPQFVEIMEFSAGVAYTGGGSSDTTLIIDNLGIGNIAGARLTGLFSHGFTITSGPVIVTPGEQYRLLARSLSNPTLVGDGRTFFTGKVLQATVP